MSPKKKATRKRSRITKKEIEHLTKLRKLNRMTMNESKHHDKRKKID